MPAEFFFFHGRRVPFPPREQKPLFEEGFLPPKGALKEPFFNGVNCMQKFSPSGFSPLSARWPLVEEDHELFFF